ncbi:MAG: TldD/PmbA family protein [Oligoflexia bacterium]|nr:TldD/PmbA family protein [Oligoflexia bacterium]
MRMPTQTDLNQVAADSADKLKAHLKNADWVGLREVRETTTIRQVRDGKPQANDASTTHGVMIEVLAQGQFGYAATGKMDPESLQQAAELAHQQALHAATRSVFRFTEEQRPPVRAQFASPRLKPLGSLGAGEINQILVEISEKLKISSEIIRTEAVARLVETQMRFVSSNGSDASQDFSLITTDFQATAKSGNVIQRRTDGGLLARSHQGGWEHFMTPDLWDRVRRVAEQAIELAHSEECPTLTGSLILKPDQMMLQIHESIGHPLELDRILGDERNYAGWSFVKPSDFGTLQYGSKLMNVTFDPTLSNEFASYAFDDAGFAAKREFLIQNGVLIRGLGGLESQVRSGLPGVANARASSWNRAPIDRMANLNLEPGTSSLEDMVSSVERGVIMESNKSWSIDDFRNKFQFGCEYARLIENGKITRTVRNPNYRGVTVPFWRSLKMVGSPETAGIFGTPFCGKGEPNQIIRVGHASPTCLFENVEIFGGAS